MKYSIGIDLGTTNCAVAYRPLDDPDQPSQSLDIPQWDNPGSLIVRDTLPSFLYLPAPAEEASFSGRSEGGKWIPGTLARKRAADRPGAVAHSVKSWLCHQAVDRTRRILPWGSSEIPAEEKLSPIDASALLLNYLRHVWNSAMAAGDPGADFDRQAVTITVPASFDAVAQRLTLEAGKSAGYSGKVTLLEEPQAAFYCWLEDHPDAGALLDYLPELADRPQHVVVADIGGGTSDFSLFRLSPITGGGLPSIERVAVSEHLLLGGDNIDLALARLFEPRFSTEGEHGALTGRQWSYLVAQCRELKERVLGNSGGDDSERETTHSLSIPGAGSGLFAGTLTAEVQTKDITKLVMHGFFPPCGLTEIPDRHRSALREMGLPYAAESAITRHLAFFLNGHPRIDAILFNGGTLAPDKLRRRLIDQVAEWQDGHAPVPLETSTPNLAVARGAAHYGSLAHRSKGARIQAGVARAIYLEIANPESTADPDPTALLCILPRDTQPGVTVKVNNRGLQLRLGEKVLFQPWYATRGDSDPAGAVRKLDPERFRKLPPLQTIARSDEGENSSAPSSTAVELRSELNEVGVLAIACVSTKKKSGQTWPLEFDLRSLQGTSAEGGARPASSSAEGADGFGIDISPEDFAKAENLISRIWQGPADKRTPVTPANLLRNLETILHHPKQEWTGSLLRSLWPALYDRFDDRNRSVEHEETWISLAGYLLRPGYGAPLDEERLDQLWRLHETGLAFPGKRNRIQAQVMGRRIAGGLVETRQIALITPELPVLREGRNPPADLIRLAGALERLPTSLKEELARLFLDRGVSVADEDGHAAPYFAALASLLSRTPLYGGAETVLPATLVEEAFERTQHLDWESPRSLELRTLFLRGARLTGDRHLDVPKTLGKRIYAKLERAGVPGSKLNPLVTFVALGRMDQAQLFGESLPPGLTLS